MTRRDLAFLATLPFAVLADVLKDIADRLDTKHANALNGETDD